MRHATAVRMMRLDAHADDERAVRLPAHEERAEMVQERAGPEQRLEVGWGIGIGHGMSLWPWRRMREMNVWNWMPCTVIMQAGAPDRRSPESRPSVRRRGRRGSAAP